jgi:ssDNA-binding Zn-finger/Zn-ribbon topoisomerase 1
MSENKDRLGNKLHEREKAEEDRYFEKQNRASLEKIRKESVEENTVLGLCPKCGVELVPREAYEITVDDCEQCGGIWLDKGELERLVERESESGAAKFIRSMLK